MLIIMTNAIIIYSFSKTGRPGVNGGGPGPGYYEND